MTKAPAEKTFEQAVARLEEIVKALDNGDLPLDEALKLFEEGVKLAGICSSQLSDAQGRLEKLTKKPDGSTEVEPMDTI